MAKLGSAGRNVVKYLAMIAFSLLIPQLAWATAGENEWRFGIAASPVPSVAVDAGILHDFTDFWAFGASIRAGHSFASVPSSAAAATADLRLAIDALQWIPAIELGLGANLSAAGLSPSARAGLSLTWRPARTWGLAAHFDAQASSLQTTEMWAGLQFVHFGGSGIGLDL